MKIIPLRNGLVALVDDEDYERVTQRKWFLKAPHNPKYSFYAHANKRKDGRGAMILLHRLVMNAPDGIEVDHIDGDGLNNQKSNLRLCNRGQNLRNQKIRNPNGLKGVFFRVSRIKKPWAARISIGGRTTAIGYFSNKIDAAISYNISAKKNFGEFARLNPIPFTYE